MPVPTQALLWNPGPLRGSYEDPAALEALKIDSSCAVMAKAKGPRANPLWILMTSHPHLTPHPQDPHPTAKTPQLPVTVIQLLRWL